jgi:membrane-bound lytic murein transglycosylase MltF
VLAIRPRYVEAPPLPSPEEGNELIVLVLPGPIVYFPGPDGVAVGFDADLVRLYAKEKKLPLRFVTADSPAELLDAIAKAQVHIGAGGLFRPMPAPAAPKTQRPTVSGTTDGSGPDVLWTMGYFSVEPVLIYNSEGYRPRTGATSTAKPSRSSTARGWNRKSMRCGRRIRP